MLCCLIDWLTMVRVRWRKTGEYLVHTGFVLLTVAYLWGNLSGFRSGPHRLAPGDRMSIPNMPGYLLQLEEFTPQIGPGGRPLDMINKLVLWKNGRQGSQKTIRINHPLIYDGLVILPSGTARTFRDSVFIYRAQALSISQRATACRFRPISRLWFTDSRRCPSGQTRSGHGDRSRLNNPALQLSLLGLSGYPGQGRHFLRRQLPEGMGKAAST